MAGGGGRGEGGKWEGLGGGQRNGERVLLGVARQAAVAGARGCGRVEEGLRGSAGRGALRAGGMQVPVPAPVQAQREGKWRFGYRGMSERSRRPHVARCQRQVRDTVPPKRSVQASQGF